MAAKGFRAGRVFVQVIPTFEGVQKAIERNVSDRLRESNEAEERNASQIGERVGRKQGEAQGKARAREQSRYLAAEAKQEAQALRDRYNETKRQEKAQFDARLAMAKEARRAEVKEAVEAARDQRRMEMDQARAASRERQSILTARHNAERAAEKAAANERMMTMRSELNARSQEERRATVAHAGEQRRRTQAEKDASAERLASHRSALRIHEKEVAASAAEERRIRRDAERDRRREAEATLRTLEGAERDYIRRMQQANADAAGARGRAIRKSMTEALKALPPIDIDANSTRAERRIANVRKSMQDLGRETLTMNISSDDAEQRIRYIGRELEGIKSRAKEGTFLRVNTNEAIRSLQELDGQTRRSRNEIDSLANDYRTFQPIVLAVATALPVIPQLAAVGAAALGTMTTIAATAGTSILAVVAGFSGIGEAMKALSKQQENAAKNSQAAAKQQAAAARQVATAQEGVRTAQQRVADQKRSVVEAQQAVGKAHRDAARAAADAARQTADAQQAVKEAVRDAARANQDAARKVKDAQAQVREAHVEAAEAMKRASREVRDAERDLADANRDSRQAQLDLNEARRQAVQDMADLNREVRRGRLDERQAVLDVKDAEADLRKARSGGNKTDIEKAQIRLERQKLTLEETRAENKELAREKAKSDKDGVNGSQKVVDAQQRVRDAITAQRDAQQKLVDARAAQQKARVDSAKRIADAERGVSDALRDQRRTAEDGQARILKARRDLADAIANEGRVAEDNAEKIASANKRVKDSQRGVAEAQRGLATAQRALTDALNEQRAGTPMSTDALKTKQAMEDLSPAGRRFAKYLVGMKEDFKGIRNIIQQGMIPGVMKSMEELRKRYAPGLKRFAGTMGRVLGDEFGKMGKWLQSPVWQRFFAMLEEYTPVFTRLFFGIGKNLADVFAGVAVAFAPLTKDFLKWLDKASKGWAKWAENLEGSDGFEKFLQFVKENAPALKDFFKALGKALIEMGKAGAPVGVGWLKVMTGLLNIVSKIPEPILTAMITLGSGIAMANQLRAGMGIVKESVKRATPGVIREPAARTIERGKNRARVAGRSVVEAPIRYSSAYHSSKYQGKQPTPPPYPMVQQVKKKAASNQLPAQNMRRSVAGPTIVPAKGAGANRIGSDYAKGLALGIQSGTPSVTRAARNMGLAAIRGMREVLRIKSPSRVAFLDGENFILGFRNALSMGAAGVAAAARRVGTGAAAALRQGASPKKGAQAAAALPPVVQPKQPKQPRGQRVARAAGAGGGVAMGGLMVASMLPGKIGESAGTAMTAVMGLSMALSSIPSGALTKAGAAMKSASLSALTLAKNVALSAAAFVRQGVQAALSAARMVAVKAAQLAIATATKIWTAAQWLLNVALNANPISLIILAIAGLVAAFVIAYKKVGWFRDGVNAVWGAIKGASIAVFNWFKGVFQKSWNAILPILTWPFRWMIVGVKAIFDSKSGLRRVLSSIGTWIKNSFFVKIWKGTLAFLTWPFRWMVSKIKGLFDSKSGVRKLLNSIGSWIKNSFFVKTWKATYNTLTWPFRWLVSKIKSLFSSKNGGVRHKLNSLATWVKNTFKKSWNKISGVLTAPFSAAIKTIRGLFSSKSGLRKFMNDLWTWARDTWKKSWEGLSGILSKPIKATITFINEKIVDKINGVLPGNPVPRIPGGNRKPKGKANGGQVLPGRADGGQIPGYFGGGVIRGPWKGPKADNVLGLDVSGTPTAMVNPLEFIHPVAAVKHYGLNAMEAVRQRKATIIPSGAPLTYATGGQVGSYFGSLPRFESGGQAAARGHTWPLIWNYVRKHFPGIRKTSDFRPGAMSNRRSSHSMGTAIDIAGSVSQVSKVMRHMLRFASNFRDMIYTPLWGWRMISDGKDIRTPRNLYMQHKDHGHLGLLPGRGLNGKPVSLSGSAMVGDDTFPDFTGITAKINSFVKKLGIGTNNIGTQVLSGFTKEGGSAIIKEGKKRFDAAMEAMSVMPGPWGGAASLWNKITGKGSAKIKNAVKKAFAPYGWNKGRQWDAVDWLVNKESSWRPGIKNRRSTAYGLFQFLNKTWGTVGGRKTSDPYLQGVYGARYIKKTYGTPTGAVAFHRRRGWYGDGGQHIPDGMIQKPSIKGVPSITLPKGHKAPVFDNAGTLAPGLNLVQNRLGRPEPLRREDTLVDDLTKAFATVAQDLMTKEDLEGMAVVLGTREVGQIVGDHIELRDSRGVRSGNFGARP